MEQKNLGYNKNLQLTISRLQEKKNWFIVSIIIMLVTIVIIPMSLNMKINESNIVFGMFEIFLLVFVNCLIDFSYLHNDRKFAYYASKPITSIRSINLWIITNFIYAAVLVSLLGIIAVFTGSLDHINEIFIVAVPWLIAGIFTAALSSVISGNTVAAGISTIINFTLPLSILGVIAYAFKITEDFTLGFKMEILFQKFVENIYRIDILYFIKYAEDEFDFTFFIVLAVILAFIYSLTVWLNKKRKNEKIGEMVVFDGYKKLISVIISSLAPFIFSAVFNYTNVQGKIISFIVLSALTYYIMNAVLEKSFSLKISTVRFYGIFLSIYLVFIVIANFATDRYESYIPDENEISAVYFGRDFYMYSEEYEESKSLYSADEEFMETVDNIVLYKDSFSISGFQDLHREILENQDYSRNENFAIVYYLKNGKTVARYYKLRYSEEYTGTKDKIIGNIVSGKEYKMKRYPFLYDSNYISGMVISNIDFHMEKMNDRKPLTEHDIMNTENKYLLFDNIKKDHENAVASEKYLLRFINEGKNNYNYNYYPDRYGDYVEHEVQAGYTYYYLNINYMINGKEKYKNINFDDNFTNTVEYLSGIRQ